MYRSWVSCRYLHPHSHPFSRLIHHPIQQYCSKTVLPDSCPDPPPSIDPLSRVRYDRKCIQAYNSHRQLQKKFRGRVFQPFQTLPGCHLPDQLLILQCSARLPRYGSRSRGFHVPLWSCQRMHPWLRAHHDSQNTLSSLLIPHEPSPHNPHTSCTTQDLPLLLSQGYDTACNCCSVCHPHSPPLTSLQDCYNALT